MNGIFPPVASSAASLIIIMSQFILKRLLRLSQFRTFSSSKATKSTSESVDRSSFTVNYLMGSCGLTPERALSISKRVNFEKADKPNSVLAFFKDQGFTNTQVSKMVHSYPSCLNCNPEKIFLPKLKFLKSRGLSDSEVLALVSKSSRILGMSLENSLIPLSNFFSNLLKSEKKANKAFKFFLRFPVCVEKYAEPNIEILTKAGVPLKNIGSLVTYSSQVLSSNHDRLRNALEEVREMGFDPSKVSFLAAIHVLVSISKETWERKFEIYKQWSWSEDDILSAFRRYPWCMALSEDKFTLAMEFLVNKMDLKPSTLARRPKVIGYSLEKRIMPRCIIYQALVSKGLQKSGDSCLITMITLPEKYFLEKVIGRHEDDASDLLKL